MVQVVQIVRFQVSSERCLQVRIVVPVNIHIERRFRLSSFTHAEINEVLQRRVLVCSEGRAKIRIFVQVERRVKDRRVIYSTINVGFRLCAAACLLWYRDCLTNDRGELPVLVIKIDMGNVLSGFVFVVTRFDIESCRASRDGGRMPDNVVLAVRARPCRELDAR